MTDSEYIDPFKSNLTPIDYAIMFGEDNLYGWQQQVMLDVWNGKPTALCTCNSSGKTSKVIANLGLAIMAHFPGARIMSTSGSWMQIETQLWPILRDKVSGVKGWDWNKKEIKGPVVEIEGKTFQSSWNPFSTDDPNRAEGHHNRSITLPSGREIVLPVAYIIDEAKSVDPGIFDAMNRCRLSFKLIASSPGTDLPAGEEHIGNFYDAFNRNADLWTSYVIDWTKCDHMFKNQRERKKIEADIRIKGREHPLIKSQYFAEFFRHGGYFVFDSNDIKSAMGGLNKKVGHDRCGAFDWSAGGDEQVWGVREGNQVMDMKIWHEKDDVKLAKLVHAEICKWRLNANDLFFDVVGGGGKGLVDNLEAMGMRGINRYRANEAPNDATRYYNKYAEDAFERLSFWLKSLIIPKDEELERQLKEREYFMPNDDSCRIRLEPKESIRKRGGRSPDRLDVLIMLFSSWRPYNFDREKQFASKKHLSRCPGITECVVEDDDDRSSKSAFGGWIGDSF